MNATIQCLKTVPELCDALKEFKGGRVSDDGAHLTILTCFLLFLVCFVFFRGQSKWWQFGWICYSCTA